MNLVTLPQEGYKSSVEAVFYDVYNQIRKQKLPTRFLDPDDPHLLAHRSRTAAVLTLTQNPFNLTGTPVSELSVNYVESQSILRHDLPPIP